MTTEQKSQTRTREPGERLRPSLIFNLRDKEGIKIGGSMLGFRLSTGGDSPRLVIWRDKGSTLTEHFHHRSPKPWGGFTGQSGAVRFGINVRPTLDRVVINDGQYIIYAKKIDLFRDGNPMVEVTVETDEYLGLTELMSADELDDRMRKLTDSLPGEVVEDVPAE